MVATGVVLRGRGENKGRLDKCRYNRLWIGPRGKEMAGMVACPVPWEAEKAAERDFGSHCLHSWAFVIPGIRACDE